MKYKTVVQLPRGVTDLFCADMGIDRATWYRYRVLSYGSPDWETPDLIRRAAMAPKYGGKITKVLAHKV